MNNILSFKNNIAIIYRKYDFIFNSLIKIILSFIVYKSIFNLNSYNEFLAPFLSGSISTMMMLILIVLFLILPMSMNLLIMSLLIVLMISSQLYLAILLFFIFLTIFICYTRLAEQECIILLLTILAFKINMPYLIPLICAIYFPITFVFPMIIGTYVFYLLNNLDGTIALFLTPEYLELDIIEQFTFALKNVVTSSIFNETFIFMSFTLASMALISFIINKMDMDRIELIGIASAGIVGLVGIIIIVILGNDNFSLFLNIFTCIFSCLVAYISTLFDAILDYKSTKKVRFSDENNVYYVKVVPKVTEFQND